MFGRQRKKQDGQRRHQYEVANKYVFKCRCLETILRHIYDNCVIHCTVSQVENLRQTCDQFYDNLGSYFIVVCNGNVIFILLVQFYPHLITTLCALLKTI